MTAITPLFVKANKAAKLLDMTPAEFKELVKAGSLPPPNKLDRWDVELLVAIMRNHAIPKPDQDFTL